jgi:hypothetical protein
MRELASVMQQSPDDPSAKSRAGQVIIAFMAEWFKHGRLFEPNGQRDWMITHAQLPVVDDSCSDTLRIYFASRDAESRSRVGFIEVNPENPREIVRISDTPALDLGDLGCFDDQGVLPSWIVNYENRKYLFYIGVNTATNVTGRTAIGVAESFDDGKTFQRIFYGPIVERFATEPHLCTSPCVLAGAVWRMWYTSGTSWKIVSGRPEPFYRICVTESVDGLNWRRPGSVAIDLDSSLCEAGLGKPCVLFDRGRYRMWFCSRGEDYRSGGPGAYRIAYAESTDQLAWERMPVQPGMSRSDTGWDSEMIAYPFVFARENRLHMVYNGNGFGESGFGYAVLDGPLA